MQMQFQWIIVIDSLNDKNYWAYKAGAPAADILHDLRQELQLSAQQGELRSGHVLIGDDEAVPAGIYKFYRDSGMPTAASNRTTVAACISWQVRCKQCCCSNASHWQCPLNDHTLVANTTATALPTSAD